MMEIHPDIRYGYMQQKRAEIASNLTADISDFKGFKNSFKTAQIIVGQFANNTNYGRFITDFLNEAAREELTINYPYTDNLFSETKEQYSRLLSHLHKKGYINYNWSDSPRVIPTEKFRKELEEITK